MYNIQQIQQNFNFSAGTSDQELNNFTPQMAMAAAQIITQSIANQHPLRVNAMNVFGQNGFANQEFRGFITHVMRITHAMFLQKQVNNISQIISGKLPEFVQLASAALATRNPAVLQCLDQNTLMTTQQMAQQWFQMAQGAENLLAQAQQQMQMGGFQNNGMMMQPTQMNNGFGVQQQNPLNSYGTTFGGGNTGAFTEAGSTNFNAAPATQLTSSGGLSGRYQRKLQQEMTAAATQQVPVEQPKITYINGQTTPANFNQSVESTTSIMLETPDVQPVKVTHRPGASFQERLQAEMEATRQQVEKPLQQSSTQSILERQQAAAEANKVSAHMVSFQDQVKEMGAEPVFLEPVHKSVVHDSSTMTASIVNRTATPEEVIAAIEPKPVLKEFVLNGHTFRVVSILENVGYVEAGWAPSKYQSHFPAWCRRTHEIMYAVNDEGDVIAVAMPISEEQKSKMFSYEAHALDPTKGLPAKPVEVPVREEAKILYSQDLEPEVNVEIRPEELNATGSEDLTQQVVVDSAVAFEKEPATQYYASSGIVLTTITANTAEAAQEAYDQVRNVCLQVSFDAAAKAVAEIKMPSLRRRVDKLFTRAINDVLALQLGLDAAIDSFINEGGTIIEDVEQMDGQNYATILTTNQSKIIASVCDAHMPLEALEHHQSMIDASEDISDAASAKMFYLSHKAGVMVSRYTEDEMAIGLAPYGACLLKQDCYPSLYAAIRKLFESKYITTTAVTMLTVDGTAYKVAKSLVSPESYLIMGA